MHLADNGRAACAVIAAGLLLLSPAVAGAADGPGAPPTRQQELEAETRIASVLDALVRFIRDPRSINADTVGATFDTRVVRKGICPPTNTFCGYVPAKRPNALGLTYLFLPNATRPELVGGEISWELPGNWPCLKRARLDALLGVSPQILIPPPAFIVNARTKFNTRHMKYHRINPAYPSVYVDALEAGECITSFSLKAAVPR